MRGLSPLQVALRGYARHEKARILARFFKTAPGEYGEGDRFLGVTVPDVRRLVRSHRVVATSDIRRLADSPYHEDRLFGLLLLVRNYEQADLADREKLFRTYLSLKHRINNWDLVDVTAPNILGMHLMTKSRKLLHRLAASSRLWDRRLAIVSTLAFIRKHDFSTTFELARKLMADSEDLIHKATGWMLREIGKRDLSPLVVFLHQNAAHMPRTMLRYAIERFPENRRKAFLSMKFEIH
jgi:3-methyladenine DNA glycosylase AlkD